MSNRYYAVLLAAGAASRFGGSKLTASWRGGVLIEAALASARAAPVGGVIVVTGAHAELVATAVRNASAKSAGGPEVELVACARHADGMSASLVCGLRALPFDAAGAFVFLGDMPSVPANIAPRLLAAVEAGAWAAAPMFQECRGHPVLLSARLFEAVFALRGDTGGKALLDGLGERLTLIETDDPGVLTDIDRRGDLGAGPAAT